MDVQSDCTEVELANTPLDDDQISASTSVSVKSYPCRQALSWREKRRNTKPASWR